MENGKTRDEAIGKRPQATGKERRIADLIWPYLQAWQDEDETGNPEFDRRVFSAADLSRFLARKIVEAPDDDLP